MNQILNPYIAGAPVVEASMFFGRKDVFTWIERSLTGKYIDNILVLHGQRRVGKTSVLKQIPNFLPDNYIQVFFDLQGRTSTTPDRFLWWLASEITRTVNRELGANLPRPDRSSFSDAEYLINEFLPGLRPTLGDKVLLLTFDEFDSLDRPDIQETFARPLIFTLRRLIEIDGLSFIFSIGSSGDKLENMQASYTDFFKSALYRKISFLTEDDSVRLITRPVEGVITYDSEAVNQIITITSGHPYFTQLMCHELFSLCQKTGSREISLQEVEAVLGDVIERGTVNLKFIWDEASDLEKWILAALAELEGTTKPKLVSMLQAQKVRFSESDLNSALIHLQDKDVITKDYRFVIYLMRLWLEANRPMDRVREELVEANPIANRYIEIGDEYRDRGQSEPALESYQQALGADPGNLKAQLNIASVYLENEEYTEAVAAFELAMKIDDEDIVARTGYCDAHIALAEDAESRGEIEEAFDLYQAILVVNPAHADARQRLAVIYRERAENMLLAGQDDEALQTFNQALMLMPDDEQLSARYEEVLADKKAKVVESLRQKAEKAATVGDWSGAISAWESYLTLEPDEAASIQPKLEHAKKYAGLDADYDEAQQAIRQKHYGRAIELLQSVIVQDPSYKSASRLLAEAVEANKVRTPIWQRRGVIPAVIGVIVVVLGVLFGPQAWEAVSTALTSSPAEATPASPTLRVATGTPEQDQIVFSEEALVFFNWMDDATSYPPNYIEDFSITNAYFQMQYQPPVYSVSLGELRIQDALSDEIDYTLWRYPEWRSAGDFCLEFEFTPEVFDYGSQLFIYLRGNQRGAYQFVLHPDGTWRFSGEFEAGDGDNLDGQTADLNMGHTYQFQVCAVGDQMGIVLDGEPLTFMEDPLLADGEVAISVSYYKPVQLIVDNIEFWDFQLYEEGGIPENATPDFYQPVRRYLQMRAPDFYEDFSNRKPYMKTMDPGQNGIMLDEYVSDGSLYFSTSEAARFDMVFPQLRAANFALQIDFTPTGDEFDGLSIAQVEGYGFYTNTIFWELGTAEGPIKAKNFHWSQIPNTSYTLLLIYFDSQFAAFLDGHLSYVEGLELTEDRQLIIMTDSENQVNISFDNLKFWNLDGLEMSEVQNIPDSLPPTILDYIEAYDPDFLEDFANPPYLLEASASKSDGEFFPVEQLVQEGVLLIEDTVEEGASAIQIEFDELHAKNAAVQIDFQPLGNNGYSTIGLYRQVPAEGNGSPTGYLTRMYLETTEGGNYFDWFVEEQLPDGTPGYFPRVYVPTSKGPGDTFQLLLIFYDGRYEAYLDGVKFDYMDGLKVTEQDILSIVTLTEDQLQFAVDNLKFWDLDQILLDANEQVLEKGIVDFYMPILNYTLSADPSFAEDFETPQDYWNTMMVIGEEDSGSGLAELAEVVQDGAVRFDASLEPAEAPTFKLWFEDEVFQAESFALQFDFTPISFFDNDVLQILFSSTTSPNAEYRFTLENRKGGLYWELNEQSSGGTALLTSGLDRDFDQIGNTLPLQMYVYNGQIIVFLNGALLLYQTDLQIENHQVRMYFVAEDRMVVDIDNILFWNLDGQVLSE